MWGRYVCRQRATRHCRPRGPVSSCRRVGLCAPPSDLPTLCPTLLSLRGAWLLSRVGRALGVAKNNPKRLVVNSKVSF